MRPERIEVSEDCAALRIQWPGGRAEEIPASVLRAQARDAASVRARIDHGGVTVAEGLTITGVEAVGAMGVNLHFSDGHDRAIYPWPYLREIADGLGN